MTDLATEYGLSQHEEAWRRQAAEFARKEVAPHARAWDRAGRIPKEFFPKLGASGLLGAALPASAGGGGATALAAAAIAEELGAVDGSVRGFLAVQAGLVSAPLVALGTPAQRSKWIPGLLSGQAIGCCAITEPGAGSDLGAISTTIRFSGKAAVIDGEKVWITNGGMADLALVFGTVDPSARTKGLECWLVPTSTPGFRAETMTGHTTGHRASNHARLVFEKCRVPLSHRLGGEREGFDVAMHALEAGRLNVAAGAVGIHRACLEAATAHARSRRQFGQRIGDFQQVGAALAEMEVDLRASRLLVHHAARLRDRGLDSFAAVAAAKLRATESALRAATVALQVLGARGYSDEAAVERHWRDAMGLTIYEGTSHIQRVILSRALLGRDEGAPA